MSRAIDLFLEKGEQSPGCKCKYVLTIYFEVALRFSSNSIRWSGFISPWRDSFFDDAQAHTEYAKLHATDDNDAYLLAQALVWYGQHRLEEAESEALRAVDAFEKLGAVRDVERVMELLRQMIDLDAGELDD